MIHHPIPIFVFKTNDLADRIIGTGTIYVLHVGAPLGHIHSPISIPYADGWFGDHGIVRYELKGISRLDLERFLTFCGCFKTYARILCAFCWREGKTWFWNGFSFCINFPQHKTKALVPHLKDVLVPINMVIVSGA